MLLDLLRRRSRSRIGDRLLRATVVGSVLSAVVLAGAVTSPARAGAAAAAVPTTPVIATTSVSKTFPVAASIRDDVVNTATHTVYGRNRGANTLQALNVATGALTTTTIPDRESAMAVDSTTNRLYVAHYTADFKHTTAAQNFIQVLDGTTLHEITRIWATGRPTAMAVNEKTNKLYAVDSYLSRVLVIDLAKNSIAATIPNVSPTPSAGSIAVDPVANRIYVTDEASVDVVDGAADTIVGSVFAGFAGSEQIAVDPQTHKVYVEGASGDHSLAVLSGQSLSVVATVALPIGEGPIAVDPTTHSVFVLDLTGSVAVVDETFDTVVQVFGSGSPLGAASNVAVDTATGKQYFLDLAGHRIVETTTRTRSNPLVPGELRAGQSVNAQQPISSPSGEFALAVQADGRLVESDFGREIWSPSGVAVGARLVLQIDGNAVVYNSSGVATWNSGTSNAGPASPVLRVGDDGTLVISESTGVTWATTPPDTSTLRINAPMPAQLVVAAGQSLHIGTARLVMQSDGNLVDYVGSDPVWWSGTQGNPGARFVLQADENAVVYSASGTPLWNAGTNRPYNRDVRFHIDAYGNLSLVDADGPRWSVTATPTVSVLSPATFAAGQSLQYGDAQLVQQGDGNLVDYLGSTPVWSAGTAGHPGAVTQFQTDGNLVVYSATGQVLWASYTTGGGATAVLGISQSGTVTLTASGRTMWQVG